MMPRLLNIRLRMQPPRDPPEEPPHGPPEEPFNDPPNEDPIYNPPPGPIDPGKPGDPPVPTPSMNCELSRRTGPPARKRPTG